MWSFASIALGTSFASISVGFRSAVTRNQNCTERTFLNAYSFPRTGRLPVKCSRMCWRAKRGNMKSVGELKMAPLSILMAHLFHVSQTLENFCPLFAHYGM